MHRIQDTLTQVCSRINAAATANGRNAEEITLLGVSKKQPLDKLISAYQCGLRHFGENYLQEAMSKQAAFNAQGFGADTQWHFIGPIQSNKTKQISEHFSWVHSVDRLKIAQRLNDQRPASLPPLNICLQVNIDNESSKSGAEVKEVDALASAISKLDRLSLRGLMVIPRPPEKSEDAHLPFRHCRALMQKLNSELGLRLDTLSMGMSSDLDAAIAEGSTIVRIGTALFGERG